MLTGCPAPVLFKKKKKCFVSDVSLFFPPFRTETKEQRQAFPPDVPFCEVHRANGPG